MADGSGGRRRRTTTSLATQVSGYFVLSFQKQSVKYYGIDIAIFRLRSCRLTTLRCRWLRESLAFAARSITVGCAVFFSCADEPSARAHPTRELYRIVWPLTTRRGRSTRLRCRNSRSPPARTAATASSTGPGQESLQEQDVVLARQSSLARLPDGRRWPAHPRHGRGHLQPVSTGAECASSPQTAAQSSPRAWAGDASGGDDPPRSQCLRLPVLGPRNSERAPGHAISHSHTNPSSACQSWATGRKPSFSRTRVDALGPGKVCARIHTSGAW